ncbi:MAG: hypothetical protein M9890_05785 [Thermomicrobiales bacterium]|nr:hypothetical protein [Thermomicrobiales bacterium]
MPRIPNPPRKGHPARPPRKSDEQADKPKPPARSFGQSAPMPESDDALEDLALEPMRENGDEIAHKAEAAVAESEPLEDLTLEPHREGDENGEAEGEQTG